MHIFIEIPFHESVLTFDPFKILKRIQNYFPTFMSNFDDILQQEVARFKEFLIESTSSQESKDLMRRQIQRKWERNGPVFRFDLYSPHNHIVGWTKRYSIHFTSETSIELPLQQQIVNFALLLPVGSIFCDEQTALFTSPCLNHKEYWELSPRPPFSRITE